MLELSPKLEWVPVLAPEGKAYRYPQDDVKCLRKGYSKPVVYRWVLSGQAPRSQFLVGETGEFYKRLQAYVGSTARRHVKIREVFDRERALGGAVGLEILKFESFALGGVVFAEDRLHCLFVRRVLENVCCALLSQEGFDLLNDTGEKRAVRKIARESGLSQEQVLGVIRQVRSGKTTSTPSH